MLETTQIAVIKLMEWYYSKFVNLKRSLTSSTDKSAIRPIPMETILHKQKKNDMYHPDLYAPLLCSLCRLYSLYYTYNAECINTRYTVPGVFTQIFYCYKS